MTSPLAPLHAQSLSAQAYQTLRAAIVGGDLPWGERITERGLAQALGISATPVREALGRLEHEHLVERTGPRSLFVASVSARARAESGVIEAALAGVAARFAAGNASRAQFDAMAARLDDADAAAAELRAHRGAGPGDRGDAVRRVRGALRAFHALVEQAADNEQVARMLEQARAFTGVEHLAAAEERIAADTPTMARRNGQHRDILAALRARDGARAELLMREHVSGRVADCA